jgi:hypothetical protein
MGVHEKLVRHGDALCEAMSEFAESIGATTPALAHVARSALGDLADDKTCVARLFPVVVLCAMGGSSVHGVPAAVVSGLWWSGLERLGHAGSPHATQRAMSAMTVLPHLYLDSLRSRVRMRREWAGLLNTSTSSALNRVLTGESPQPLVVTRERALAHHFATFGAAHLRDAAMASAALPGTDVERWRRFGLLYGLLLALTEDGARDVDGPGAQAGHPPLLLVAHAFAVNRGNRAYREQLVRLRLEANVTPVARVALNDLVHSRFAVRAYNHDVDALRRHVLEVLAGLAKPSPYRALLEQAVESAALAAQTRPREAGGAEFPQLRLVSSDNRYRAIT